MTSVVILNAFPIFLRPSASFFASDIVFIKVPLPTFRSITSPLRPSAIFLLIIELQINGREGTVPVRSLIEYRVLSAGQISVD